MSEYIKHLNELNPKDFSIGQIVYYVNPYRHTVEWGVVKEYYSDGYGLALYEIVDARTVEGVPIAEYDFQQKPRKLPKGWSYNTDLVHLGMDEAIMKRMKEEVVDYSPENLKHLTDCGLFVRPSSQDKSCNVEDNISKDGYTIVKKYSYSQRSRSDFACVNWHFCYHTVDEARAVVNAYKAELKRQAGLSEAEWSIEQIDKTLSGCYNMNEEAKKATREWLLNREKEDGIQVEDIETRCFGGVLQWKKWHNKTWKEVAV